MQIQNDLLGDFDQEIQAEPVSTGTRFTHYLLDFIIYNIVYYGITAVFGTDTLYLGVVGSLLFSYVIYLLYYTLMEGLSGGRTIGKLVTGSIVVREDGTALTFNDALKRSLCRLVPFEPFSAFGGSPWHDRWTDTKVVSIKRN